MTKSKAAFLISVKSLFEQKKRVYMWTFTTAEVVDDEVAFQIWQNFSRTLKRKFNDSVGVPGIRVVEVHPGDGFLPGGHGLHFHLLVARRLDVNVVRRLANGVGFGRIHVCRADLGSAKYLAKYLAKSDDGLRKGTRRWAMFGSFVGTKVRNIIVESEFADNCRTVAKVLGTWGYALYCAVMQLTVKWGHCTEWPLFPALAERGERSVGSDNDYKLPWGCDKNGRKARFEMINVFQTDVEEWVKVLVPARVCEPF